MKNLVEVIEKLSLAEVEKYKDPINYYYLSREKAVKMAQELGANVDFVIIGCALMDIKLGECTKLGIQGEHVKKSYEYAKQILNENNVDSKTQDILLNCVEAHHGGVPFRYLEAEICANADCYRFIHPQGVFTWIQTLTKRGKTQNEAVDLVMAKLEEKHNILSLKMCKKELEPFYKQIKALLLNSKIN